MKIKALSLWIFGLALGLQAQTEGTVERTVLKEEPKVELLTYEKDGRIYKDKVITSRVIEREIIQPAPLPQAEPSGLRRLAVAEIRPLPALAEKSTASGTRNALERVVQALDSQLIDRVHQTRRFQVVARSDLAALRKDAEATAGAFKLEGVDYLLVTTLEHFQDYTERRHFESLGKTAAWRIINLAAVGKLYEASTGRLLETASFPLEIRDQEDQSGNFSKNGELSDRLLQEISTQLAERIANRVADVIYPARVLSKQDRQLTFNRGEGTLVSQGQIWAVFAQGKELIDPDTGVSLGREEMEVGKVRVVRVTPKLSMAEILEDTGIERNAVLRLAPEPAP